VSLVAVGYVPPLTESMESSGGLWHLGENAAQEKNALGKRALHRAPFTPP